MHASEEQIRQSASSFDTRPLGPSVIATVPSHCRPGCKAALISYTSTWLTERSTHELSFILPQAEHVHQLASIKLPQPVQLHPMGPVCGRGGAR